MSFGHHHASSNDDYLDLHDNEEELDLGLGLTSLPMLTRTIINDDYKPPDSVECDEERIDAAAAGLFSLSGNTTTLTDDNSLNVGVNSSSNEAEVCGGDEEHLTSGDSFVDAEDVQHEPMDTEDAANGADVTTDSKLATMTEELQDVERRIEEMSAVSTKDERRQAKTRAAESSDSSSDSGSSDSAAEDGEKSDSSKEERKSGSGSGDSKKRKVSPIAVDEEKKDRNAQHSKHKKTKNSHGDKSIHTKYVKDVKEMKIFFDDSRYFLIKSANAENVTLSKAKGVWSTTPRNEQILNKAFRETKNVILVFSVEKSQAFQGFCRLASEAVREGSPVNWVLPPGMNARNLGGVFKVHWVNRNEIPFANTVHLINPWNEYKPVKIGRDGTELAPNVARELCGMFRIDDGVDLGALMKKVKKMQSELSTNGAGGVRRRGARYSETRRQWAPPPPPVSNDARSTASRNNKTAEIRYSGYPAASGYSSSVQTSGASSYHYDGGHYSGGGGGRYDIFHGSYNDYIREFSMNSYAADPYADAFGASHMYNDAYYGYAAGYAPPAGQQISPPYPSNYSRRDSGRRSPPSYAVRRNHYNGDSFERRAGSPPPRFGDRRRRHSQSPDPAPIVNTSNSVAPGGGGGRKSTHHERRDKSPARQQRSSDYRRSGKY